MEKCLQCGLLSCMLISPTNAQMAFFDVARNILPQYSLGAAHVQTCDRLTVIVDNSMLAQMSMDCLYIPFK